MAHICLRRLVIHKHQVSLKCLQAAKRPIHVTSARFRDLSKIGVYEHDRKSGYQTLEKEKSIKERISLFFKNYPKEAKKYVGEVKDLLFKDRVLLQLHGYYEILWKFNGEESLKDWVLTTDHDNLEGRSKAFFTVSQTNRALFHGHLCTEIPKDGLLTRAGYCNIRSPYNVASFEELLPYDWSSFTHLVLRFRGDGRSYMLVVHYFADYDILWNIQHNFPLYTRGGPYWQTAKIPLSKFYSSYKGRIQDKQNEMDTSKVKSFAITIADNIDGPFKLEIDYIGLYYDKNHDEEFAYESYSHKGNTIGV